MVTGLLGYIDHTASLWRPLAAVQLTMAAPSSTPTTAAPTEAADEDWQIYEALCKDMNALDDDLEVDLPSTLRGEIAALQYKRDRLSSELQDMHQQLRTRDQRCLELQVEADQLREQAARHSSVTASLKQRLQEAEQRERQLASLRSRDEVALQASQRDARYQAERAQDLEQRLRQCEHDLGEQRRKKEAARQHLEDLARRLGSALGASEALFLDLSGDGLVHKASELVQETGRLKTRANALADQVANMEMEIRQCREQIERTESDKECLQRQSAAQLLELDRLRQDKETWEMQRRVLDRELSELREKLAICNRSLGSASGHVAQHESVICQLREDLKLREERVRRLEEDQRHTLESLAILLGSPTRFVEATESSVKERVRELVTECKDRLAQVEALKERLSGESQQLARQSAALEQAQTRCHSLEDDKVRLEARLHKAESEINALELSRDGLKRDKATFMNFLDRLARALHMEDIAGDIGVDLHTESLLLRAEQLARLENEKLVDKTALVYQLQRRVRNLREQLQRKDLHLDLLRRKLSLQEDTAKTKCLLQSERDEAQARVKRLLKQVDRLQLQLQDAKAQVRDLQAQLAEAADHKITALERGRRIEELQRRLAESEALRSRYNRRVAVLKEQVRSTGETVEQERSMGERSIHLLRDELQRLKDTLEECRRHEAQLTNFKGQVAGILGLPSPVPEYELIGRLQKLADAHHDFTLVSRRYDDPGLHVLPTRSPTASRCTARTPAFDDSGYADPPDLDDTDLDDIFKHKSRTAI